MSRLTLVDWIVVAAYLALALGAGLVIARRARGTLENFFLSGRSLPWWLAGTSMVATSFASDTPLVVTGWTRAGGVAGNWRWWGYVVSTLLVVVLFARLWQRSAVLTDVEFMELRYSGRPARFLRAFKSVYQVLFVHCFVMGWVILGMTKVLVVVLDLGDAPALELGPLALSPEWLVMLGCLAIALVYCELSGLWGVVLTDFVQFLFAMAGAVTLAVLVVRDFGGLSSLGDALRASPDAAAALSPFPDLAGVQLLRPLTWNRAFWDFAVFVLVVPFATKNADGGGVMVQRLLACRNERHAVGATLWYAVAHNAVRPWPWILVALASLLVLPAVQVKSSVAGTVVEVGAGRLVVEDSHGVRHPLEVPPAASPGWRPEAVVESGQPVVVGQVLAATDDELAYPLMMRRHVPAGFLGLLLASFLAAFMSTIDTHVNLASAYLVNDLYRRFLRPAAAPEHYVRAARFAGPAVLAIALVVAALSESVRGMFDRFTELFAGLGAVYVLRWVWWRVNAWSEVAAMLSGALATWGLATWPRAGAALLPEALSDGGAPGFAGRLLLVTAAALLVTIPVTLLTPPTDRARLAEFCRRVEPPGAWGPLRPAARRGARLGALRFSLAWLGSTVFVVACMLVQGEILLGQASRAWVWGGVGAVGLLLLALLPKVARHVPGAP